MPGGVATDQTRMRDTQDVSDTTRWPTPEQVLDALDRSGHLLEQQVASDLVGLGYSVTTGRAFIDKDEGKSREVDVYAVKWLMNDEARRVRLAVHLLVECKKTSAPFAFLTRPVPRRSRPPEEVLITLHSREERFEEEGRTYIRHAPTFEVLGLSKEYWGTADPVKAVHISRLDRKGGEWNASNTGVFDSLTWPLAEAVRAFKAPYRNPNRGFDAARDWSYVMLFVPIVVVGSKLFAADGTSASPEAKEVPHVRLHRELNGKGFQGEFSIDFVQRDAFVEFVRDTVDAFGRTMVDVVENDIDAVIPKDKWPMWTDW